MSDKQYNTPYTYADHEQFEAMLDNGEFTPETLMARFEHAASFTWGLWVTLGDLKVKELDAIKPGMRGKKASKVEQVATSCLIAYGSPTGERTLMTSYTYGAVNIFDLGKKKAERPDPRIQKVEAMRERIATITQDMLDDYAAKRQEAKRRTEKALTNPETPQELLFKIRQDGLDSLTAVQLVKWDQAYYEANREAIERERAEAAVIKQIDLGDGIEMTIEKGYHTKKQIDIWEVSLTDRVERDVFNELKVAAKKLGGYYSRFAGGFVFWEEADAQEFVSLQSEDGSAEERRERIAQMKEERAADRLLDYAQRHQDAAEATLTQERLLNTVRRVSIAQSVWADARHQQAIAKTVESVATAIDQGTAGALQGLKWVTQIVTLYGVLMDAHRAACRDEAGGYVEQGKMRPIEIGDIAHATYPKPFLNVDDLDKLAKDVKGRRGTRGKTSLVETMVKEARKKQNSYWVHANNARTADTINELAGMCREPETKKRLYEQLADHKRLTGLGIRNIFVLRHVLRDFFPHVYPEKEADPIRAAELELVGRKIDGFFPTPVDVGNLVINAADIEPGHDVLEPEAGKGNLADLVVDRFGDTVELDCVEVNPTLKDILWMKGHKVVASDFLAYNTDKRYDRIVMNPPFENGQDIEHVKKAWGMLKQNGRLVTVMSTGWTFSNRKAHQEFREFVEDHGYCQTLPDESFKESGTNVATVLVVLDN